MKPYSKVYLDEVIETQGKLFEYVADTYPEADFQAFVEAYMNSKTRKYIDEGQPYVNTMDPESLWEYFQKTDQFVLKKGKSISGFIPDWIGEFYALFQWTYGISSQETIRKVPIQFLKKAYPGLHDLNLELAVEKVGGNTQ